MPVWSFFMVFFVLSSVGLPGLNGFIGEFLCLIGAFTSTPDNATYPGVLGPWYAAIAGTGMIFAAMYLLMMTGKVVWGPLKEPNGHRHAHNRAHPEDEAALPADLTPREIGILVPLAVLCIVIGFQPSRFTDTLAKPIDNTLTAYPALVREQPRMALNDSRDDTHQVGASSLVITR
jgi:NADH-quinone oxidoreductase subunit M